MVPGERRRGCPQIAWHRLHEKVGDYRHGSSSVENGASWFQRNWEPSIACADERRLGTWGDGGKWICDPACMLAAGRCVVYSVGGNNEWSFEVSMVKRGCEVHTFDHTVAAPRTPPGVVFHRWGLGVNADAQPMRSLDSIMAELNHTRVDVFKMDIEGGEFRVLADQATVKTMHSKVTQMQIEFHYRMGVLQPGHNFATRMESVAEALDNSGFRVFGKEPNIEYSDGSCVEYAFINTYLI